MTKQKNDRAPPQCCVKLCASFCSNWLLHVRDIVRKRAIWVKIGNLCPVCHGNVISRMNLINNSAFLLCYIKSSDSLALTHPLLSADVVSNTNSEIVSPQKIVLCFSGLCWRDKIHHRKKNPQVLLWLNREQNFILQWYSLKYIIHSSTCLVIVQLCQNTPITLRDLGNWEIFPTDIYR